LTGNTRGLPSHGANTNKNKYRAVRTNYAPNVSAPGWLSDNIVIMVRSRKPNDEQRVLGPSEPRQLVNEEARNHTNYVIIAKIQQDIGKTIIEFEKTTKYETSRSL